MEGSREDKGNEIRKSGEVTHSFHLSLSVQHFVTTVKFQQFSLNDFVKKVERFKFIFKTTAH